MLFQSITETVGRTPLVALDRLARRVDARILAKVEALNPLGSVKDRVGVAMIEDAERNGRLKAGATIIEPTSGNTGIALAFAASAKGYRLILTMPERISRDRLALLEYLGAQVVLTSGSLMKDAVRKAEALAKDIEGAVVLQQFENPANPDVHRRTTAEEIWADCDGQVDVFVAGVGTGGTITGVGEVLKARRPEVKVVAVEPAGAAVLSGRPATGHFLPGLGAGFVPKILNRAIIDEVVPVTEETAIRTQLDLVQAEGISAGPSAGAALAAALHLAGKAEHQGKTFVVMLPDLGERYVNNPVFQEYARKVRA
ncbi:MAG: cysteine synthase A [Myxococcales bacterium]|nr:cysteine synthase A [Myxococcales bacterium]